jgi:hypothetical protein
MGRWSDLAKHVQQRAGAQVPTIPPVSGAEQNDKTTKGGYIVGSNPLAEYAAYASGMPKVCFTLRETANTEGDMECLRRIRTIIREHEPGGNRVVMTVFTLDGRRVYAEWRALATRELRRGIARVLAERGKPQKKEL